MILATEHGFPRWVSLGNVLRGWVCIEQGHIEQGIEQILEGLTKTNDAEQQVAVPLLAEAYDKAGQPKEGLRVVTEALARARKIGLCHYEAELHRINGELLLAQEGKRDGASEAEDCFQKAIEVARRQSAKSLELRAVMSLSRLWQKQGRKDEATLRSVANNGEPRSRSAACFLSLSS